MLKPLHCAIPLLEGLSIQVRDQCVVSPIRIVELLYADYNALFGRCSV